MALTRADVERGRWVSPEDAASADRARLASESLTLSSYADAWISERERRKTLKPRTVALYRSILRNHVDPTIGAQALTELTTPAIKAWLGGLETGETARANAYGLVRTVLGEAVDEQLIPINPARVKGAGTKRRVRELRVLTLDEFHSLVEAMPPRYQALVLLGGWCAMRFGELAALRRSDVDLKNGVVYVRRAVATVKGRAIEGTPKSDAGVRAVTIPPHIIPTLRQHLLEHAAFGRDGLVFPPASGEGFLAGSTLHRVFTPAKIAAGRPDVRVHDLRHFGAIMAARSGATLGELQQRLGHATAQAALVYQSAVSERSTQIAVNLSAMVPSK